METTARGEIVIIHCARIIHLILQAEIALAQHHQPVNMLAFLRIRDLNTIQIVCELESASAASQTLNISQPAVSKILRTFSDLLHRELFVRKAHGLIPTESAWILARLGNSVVDELKKLSTLEDAETDSIYGNLIVGMLPFSEQDIVATALARITRTTRHLKFRAIPGDYITLMEAVMAEEIDCVIGVLRQPAPYPEVQEAPLWEECFQTVARTDHPIHKTAKTITDLSQERWIVGPHGTPIRNYFDTLFRSEGTVVPTHTYEMVSFRLAEQLVAESDAIGLLSYSDNQLKKLRDDLKIIDVSLEKVPCIIGVSYRRNVASHARFALINELKNVASELGVIP